MRKYQCLTTANYQFVDADVCFLCNPENVLVPYTGFITSCGHWRDPSGTYTATSRYWMAQKSTMWQRNTFNTGQFACDQALYSLEKLKATAMSAKFVETCVRWPHNEQPGLDFLVIESGVQITNLTLLPLRMESTWAGDYLGDYEHYWIDLQRKPYLIHWAGIKMDVYQPIHEIFYQFLTSQERAEWDTYIQHQRQTKPKNTLRSTVRRLKYAFQAFAQS